MNVLTWPHESLKKVATPVPTDENCRDVIEAMFSSLDYPNGIGLAAPQIGIDKRIIVIRVPALRAGKRIGGETRHAIINPVITWFKGGPNLDYEGCLSFPGVMVLVPRYARVKVQGFTVRWEPITIGGKDLVARVLQHEIDHLNGITLDHYAKIAEEVLDEKENVNTSPGA